MSYQPERKEKDCLNCGTQVMGRYCQQCGQENIIPHQGFWSLTKHFVYDIFHFDGKFFDTLKHLLLRPGKVPEEYVKGRRTRYLDPIRMYLFTSAVFFLIFFSVNKFKEGADITGRMYLSKQDRYDESARLYPAIKSGTGDSLVLKKFDWMLDTTRRLWLGKIKENEVVADTALTLQVNNKTFRLIAENNNLGLDTTNSGWVEKQLEGKWEQYKRQYGDDPNKIIAALIDNFLHKLPYLLFLSLPLFALILKLLYIRRKQYYYSDHATFTLYHYIFSFILLLLFFGLSGLQSWLGWRFLNTVENILVLVWPVYLFAGMKRFYKQGWFKTFAKFTLVNFLGLFSLVFLFVLFIFFSIFQL